MALAETLRADLERALKEGDKRKCSVLRMALSSIHNAEIAQQKTFEDSDILGILGKEAKQRRESIEAYEKGDRADLVESEKVELAILAEYLPQQLSRDEIAVAVRTVITEVGATGPSDKGKVMSQLMPQMRGKADGQMVNEVVTEYLNNL